MQNRNDVLYFIEPLGNFHNFQIIYFQESKLTPNAEPGFYCST